MNRHTKQYSRYGNGVELFCDGEIIASSSNRSTNFSISSCPKCEREVCTTGHSSKTDKVKDYKR